MQNLAKHAASLINRAKSIIAAFLGREGGGGILREGGGRLLIGGGRYTPLINQPKHDV